MILLILLICFPAVIAASKWWLNRKVRRAQHLHRSAGAKRGWETRRQREQGLPLPMENNPLIPPKT